jgi:hypothetical protein
VYCFRKGTGHRRLYWLVKSRSSCDRRWAFRLTRRFSVRAPQLRYLFFRDGPGEEMTIGFVRREAQLRGMAATRG